MTTSTSMMVFSISDMTLYRSAPFLIFAKMTEIWSGLDVRICWFFSDLVDVFIADENGGIKAGPGFVQHADHAEDAAEEHCVHIDQAETDVERRFAADDGLAFFEPPAELFLEPGRHNEIRVLIKGDDHGGRARNSRGRSG